MKRIKLKNELESARTLIDALNAELSNYKEAVTFMEKYELKPCVSPLCATCMYSVEYTIQKPRDFYFETLWNESKQYLFCSKNIQCDKYTKREVDA